ncbi:MAG: 2-hydroxyacyl-CoA dehydratase subunit D [Actinomycetota bacterium]
MRLSYSKQQDGLFDRAHRYFGLAKQIPYDMGDEELEGLLRFLPPDARNSVSSFLTRRFRRAGIAFIKMMGRWLDQAVRAREEGRKIILVPFNFPPEVIYAFDGAVPLTSEMLSTMGVVSLEGQGERYWDFAMGLGIPDSLCSSNTIALGSMLTGGDFTPDAIVQSAPGSCDANAKIHEFAARYHDIPQFFLEKPTDFGRRGREQYSLYFRRFMEELQEFIGEELDEHRVREIMGRANRCTELYYELWDLHKPVPCPVPNIFSPITCGTRFCTWGLQEGVDMLEIMVETAKEIMKKQDYPAREEIARALWIYLPYYFDFSGFFNWMEDKGISYLDDLLTLCFPSPVDTSGMDAMLEGMAEATWNMPMTRQMGGDSMLTCWLDDIVYAVKELGANCAIYCGHHSCKQTWSVFSAVRSEIQKRAGVPTLCLQGDSWIRRMTPVSYLQDEISSFVDNVVNRKRRRPRVKNKLKNGVSG